MVTERNFSDTHCIRTAGVWMRGVSMSKLRQVAVMVATSSAVVALVTVGGAGVKFH
jgi:hypothetical protein